MKANSLSLAKLLSIIVVAQISTNIFAQVPPPPPPTRVITETYSSSLLPTPKETVYEVRRHVTLEREQAVLLEKSIIKLRSAQNRVLQEFGISSTSSLGPIRMSSRDAADLNRKLDKLADETERDVLDYLTLRQRKIVRELFDTEAEVRQKAIAEMRR